MEKTNLITLIVVALVVAVIASVITASITGNVIRLNPDRAGQYNVYTTAEIDKKLNDVVQRVPVNGSCQYVYFYMVGDPAVNRNRTARDVCQIKGGYVPQALGIYQISRLYNNNTCEGIEIFEIETISLVGKDEPNDKIFDEPLGSERKECEHSMNKNFASETKTRPISILCCKP